MPQIFNDIPLKLRAEFYTITAERYQIDTTGMTNKQIVDACVTAVEREAIEFVKQELVSIAGRTAVQAKRTELEE